MAASDISQWVGDLDETLPQESEKVSDGDDSIRHAKSVVRSTFPQMIGANSINQDKLNGFDELFHPTIDTFIIDVNGGIDPTLTIDKNIVDLSGKSINNVADGVTDGKGLANQDTTDVRYYSQTEVDLLIAAAKDEIDDSFTDERSNNYPIGCVYYSHISTNPATTLGIGAWSRIAQGRFVVGQGSGSGRSYNVGNDTVGRYTTTMSTPNMPQHTHRAGYAKETSGSSPSTQLDAAIPVGVQTFASEHQGTAYYYVSSSSTGSGNAIENSPPAYGMYIWKRTS